MGSTARNERPCTTDTFGTPTTAAALAGLAIQRGEQRQDWTEGQSKAGDQEGKFLLDRKYLGDP